MEHNLSKERLEQLKATLEAAEPYTQEEMDGIPFDEECDINRMRASLAKKILEQYYEEHPDEK